MSTTLVAKARFSRPADTRPWVVRRFPLVLLAGLLTVASLVVLHISVGTLAVSPGQVLAVLTGQAVDPLVYTVVWHLRLPRALVAVLAGAMLALAGAILQAITGNPLAEPDLTGAATGGAFFAVLWLSRSIVGWDVAPPGIEVPFVAMVGSLLAGTIVYTLSWQRRTDPVRFILTGVLVASIFRAFTSLLLLRNQNATGSILLWIIGSLNGRTWVHWNTLWPWAAVTLPIGLMSASLANVLQVGDDMAIGLGVRVEWVRGLLLLVAILLTAGAVSVVGALAFLGLIAPHLSRRLVGDDARRAFPLSAIVGAGLLLTADIVARWITQPAELPVGALMAILGAPFLMILVRRGTR